MSIKFPNSPAVGQSFTVNNIKYTWTGSYWSSKSEALAVNGDPYWAQTKILINGGLSNGTTNFTDNTGVEWTAGGNAQFDNTQYKFTPTSMYFDGSTDYFSLPVSANEAFYLSQYDFTIEAFIYPLAVDANNRTIISQYNASTNQRCWIFQTYGGNLYFRYSLDGLVVTSIVSSGISTNTWQHVAVTRQGGIIRLYLNGINIQTDSSIGTSTIKESTSALIEIGNNHSGLSDFYGWITGLRLTKGVARYIENFVVPSEAFPTKPISVSSSQTMESVGASFGDGTSADSVVDGQIGYVSVPYNGIITRVQIIADQASSLNVEVWKANGQIPTVSDLISASAPITLSSETYAVDTALSGWSTSVSAGDVFAFKLNKTSGNPKQVQVLCGVKV